jgi:hypothetical protein
MSLSPEHEPPVLSALRSNALTCVDMSTGQLIKSGVGYVVPRKRRGSCGVLRAG